MITGSELVMDMIHHISDTRADYIEMMAAAYLQRTNIDPIDVELVEEHEGTSYRWYFRRRIPTNNLIKESTLI